MSESHDIPPAPRGELPASPRLLVGAPYVRGGNTPDIGFDCFTLMAFVRWHWYGLETPPVTVPTRPLAATVLCALMIRRALGKHANVGPWRRIERPQEGCAVALGRARVSRLHHCGVWVDGGVLHALDRVGVAWTPGDRIGDLFGRVEYFDLCPRA